MKRLLLTVMTFVLAFYSTAQKANDYAANWKIVAKFEKKGLTKSAWNAVNSIYKSAQQENNYPQVIKSCLYLIQYRNMVQENSNENNIFFVDTLINNAKAPAKNILQSIQAEMYWKFLQNNRYKFYNRTKLEEEKSNDIDTWSLDKLYNKISSLYLASLQNESALKTAKTNSYDAIIIKGENTAGLRPTIYDFLTHRALNYFVNDERTITKPAYEFTIDDASFFDPASSFSNNSFKTKDTGSLYFKAIQLFQKVLKFHLKDASPAALIDVDLIRLDFVFSHANMENKDSLYENALKKIEQAYPDDPAVAQAIYLRAQLYITYGQNYVPDVKTTNQYEIRRAKKLCDSIIKKFPKTEGAIKAENLRTQILTPSLSIQTEQINIPNQPFRSFVSYANIPSLHIRIIKTSRDEMKNLDKLAIDGQDKYWEALIKLNTVSAFSINLPDLNDYRFHTTEIKMNALDKGMYLILASANADFSLTKNALTRQVINVSNIAAIHNGNDYYVLNRDNGLPLSNAVAQTWVNKYNAKTYQNEPFPAEKYIADSLGHFAIRYSEENSNCRLQITHDSDELFTDDYVYASQNYNSYTQEPKPYTFLFTDRSIYRPGQIIYFKGIVIQKDKDNKNPVIPKYKTTVILRDVYNKSLDEIELTTNEFGSYHGSFKLPEGQLNGNFTLYDSVSTISCQFNVEEYKRPKFSVELEKPTTTYRLYDSINIRGTAKAYAGNNINNATVKYRVTREVNYPIWGIVRPRHLSFRPYPYNQSSTEITNGIAQTNEKGEFIISFKALPDESVAKKDQPTFFYKVSADVTDIDGETRSGSTSVAVAYQSLVININMPDEMSADSLKELSISTLNMNDIFEKTKVHVAVIKLQLPGKIFRERYWDVPDQFTMSKEEYYKLFPYDVYKDEDQPAKWPVAQQLIDLSDSTAENSSFKIPSTAFDQGWYKITVTTKDKYGEDVKAEKIIHLTSLSEQKTENPIEIAFNKNSYEPGDKIKYSIKTGFDKIWLIGITKKINNVYSVSFNKINTQAPYQNTINVKEEDKGGISMSYAFVLHNRIYTSDKSIDIPWSDKELQLSFETFRDKVVPGSNEKWKIKVAGSKGEKVTAEVLAGMYDASLDQFVPHIWNNILDIWPIISPAGSWQGLGYNTSSSQAFDQYQHYLTFVKTYDQLGIKDNARNKNVYADPLWWLNPLDYYYSEAYQPRHMSFPKPQTQMVDASPSFKMGSGKARGDRNADATIDYMAYKSLSFSKAPQEAEEEISKDQTPSPVQIRKNLNETAFFFPDLQTDADGNVTFSFTMPEALTQWKLMTLAHTKDLASAYAEKTTITQKPLMIQPNAPRFLREGDQIEFSAKVVNLSNSAISGKAQLQLQDAATDKQVDLLFKNTSASQPFTVAAGQSIAVKFPLTIPVNFNSAITYRIIAVSGNTSDGEENALPVLSNRILVTESMPISMRNTQQKDFHFDKLLNSGSSKTLSNHALTVEYTSNPVWYAIQALPYLMEFPHECAEQTFNRYYANALASFITNSNPKIKSIFDKWRTSDTAALLSNLEKNEELKSALLQETPWVLNAESETQQKKNIALLFDITKMSDESQKAIDKLQDMQLYSGGFVWFTGGTEDRYITQYIMSGIGHLKKLNALDKTNSDIRIITLRALAYLDRKIKEDYENDIRSKATVSGNNLTNSEIQYLYMRSFFLEHDIPSESKAAYKYYMGQTKKYWLDQSKYIQAMIALIAHRNGDEATARSIIRSLKENSISSEEMGMYWKEWNIGGYYWYQAPIESQSLMIEAFAEIDKNESTINDLKTWLLKQKQTQDWRTTKATSEACYALLLTGSNWLNQEQNAEIRLGDTVISNNNQSAEAGTGYFKQKIKGSKITPEMGNIKVSISQSTNQPINQSPSWGSVYWQYFEDLDKITPAETPLKLDKKLFVEKNTDNGPILIAVTDTSTLKVGDKIKVRIVLKVDRDMEYIHMKDMRGSCMEPVDVISRYKWQDGLGYYQSTKDASTNFFFNWLPKGTYVFEYSMFVTNAGNFSNGITTIQCMYAPEFSAHSEGVRVMVK